MRGTTEKIRSLIRKGHSERALEELVIILKDKNVKLYLNQADLLHSRYFNNRRKHQLNLISNSQWYSIQNQINYALLELMDEINSDSDVLEKTQKKLMYLYSCPKGKSELRFSKEIRAIDDALVAARAETRYQLLTKPTVKADELAKLIRNELPDILHISTHATFDRGLLFEDLNGQPQGIGTDFFASTIVRLRGLGILIEVLVLNACNTVAHAEAVAGEIPWVIAHKAPIPDEAALTFSQHFYQALFEGHEIESAFLEATGALQLENYASAGNLPIDQIPVLFKHGSALFPY